jgi:hypothetical protein
MLPSPLIHPVVRCRAQTPAVAPAVFLATGGSFCQKVFESVATFVWGTH